MKPFLSFDDQINALETVKGLTVGDHEYVREYLERVGYFGLIGGYKDAFKDQSGKYKAGTRFEDIVALYEFDENLRELFLKYILRVERCIRTRLAYYFSEKHGESQAYYLDRANYTNNPKHQHSLSHLLKTMDRLANANTDYAYINYQRKTYGNAPLWVLTNAMTFGAITWFFFLTSQDIQTKVTKNYPELNRRQLWLFLNTLTKFRNVCAHGERLYSYKTISSISNTALHAKLGIPISGEKYISGKHDLFAVVIALRYLLPDADFKAFKGSLQRIINRYLKSTTAITEADLNKATGFPANWRSISRYKK